MEIDKVMTPRFWAICSMVKKCKTVADIGTDHAYIPTFLLLKGIAENAVAMDIKKGPLDRAEATTKKYGVFEKCDLRLSDGLDELKENEADVIIIAGMGGLLINEILLKNAKKHKNALFILQPMTAEDEVRRFLEKNGFEILNERLAREENKIYHILAVRFGEMKIKNELYYHLGEKLFENNDENLDFAIEKMINKYSTILKGLSEAQNEHEEKKNYALSLLNLLKTAKERKKEMEFKFLTKEECEKHYDVFYKMLEMGDDEFVPPLSARSSTTQKDLSGGKKNENGIKAYLDGMLGQNMLVCEEGGKICGFVSFKNDYTCDCIKNTDKPNIYISTALVNPDFRGRKITAKMYEYLFNENADKNIFTRTWSTNIAHTKILLKFGFSELLRIENDRGCGIDTVYYAKRREQDGEIK